MSELRTIHRVTVYADATLEKAFIQRFLALGARGYTIVACRGKGEHELVEDPFVSVDRVRIEILCQFEVGEKILEYLAGDQFKQKVVAACLETVEVSPGEKF